MSSHIEFWQTMKTSSKISMSFGFLLIVTLAVYIIVSLFDTRYKALFTDVEPKLAANIIAELEEMKVPYKISAIDNAILVPEQVVDRVRLKLSGSDVSLSHSMGYELFDNSDFGMTEFAQKINYQRALEGEISRTITSIKEVSYARVHLVLPESGLFKQKQKPPSAAVTMFMKNDHVLSSKQIVGIQRMVAASVSGLDISSINISDQNGITLNKNVHDEGSAEMVSQHFEKKMQVETYLKEKVEAVLEKTFGNAKTVISVDVTLNMDQVKTTSETVMPSKNASDGILRKRETSSTGQIKGDKTGRNTTTEYEYSVGRKVDQIVMTPGSIKRLSVGVLVPSGVSEKHVAEIRELIAMTVGVDIGRGDAIAVFTGISDSVLASYKENEKDNTKESTHNSESIVKQEVKMPLQEPVVPESKVTSDLLSMNGNELMLIKFVKENKSFSIMMIAALFALLAVLYLIIFYVKQRSDKRGRKLSNKEYQKVLTQLNQWIDADDIEIEQVRT